MKLERGKKTIIFVITHMVLCVCLNLLGHGLAAGLGLPFWLDSVGTAVMAVHMGPVPGAIVGMITNVIMSLAGQEFIVYAIVNMAVGIVVGISYPKDLTDYFQIVITAALTAVVAIVISTPLNILFYNGYCGNIWGDALYDMLEQGGSSRISCVLLSECFVDFPDKVLTLLLASGMIRLNLWISSKLGRKKDEEVMDND